MLNDVLVRSLLVHYSHYLWQVTLLCNVLLDPELILIDVHRTMFWHFAAHLQTAAKVKCLRLMIVGRKVR